MDPSFQSPTKIIMKVEFSPKYLDKQPTCSDITPVCSKYQSLKHQLQEQSS